MRNCCIVIEHCIRICLWTTFLLKKSYMRLISVIWQFHLLVYQLSKSLFYLQLSFNFKNWHLNLLDSWTQVKIIGAFITETWTMMQNKPSDVNIITLILYHYIVHMKCRQHKFQIKCIWNVENIKFWIKWVYHKILDWKVKNNPNFVCYKRQHISIQYGIALNVVNNWIPLFVFYYIRLFKM